MMKARQKQAKAKLGEKWLNNIFYRSLSVVMQKIAVETWASNYAYTQHNRFSTRYCAIGCEWKKQKSRNICY